MTTLVKHQVKSFTKRYTEHGKHYEIVAQVRFDDQCGNGHNTFAITGTIYSTNAQGRRLRDECGGCIHEDIAKHFPDLTPFLKWHLCSTDGPMHYPANVLFLAGDRDCWGLRKGEFRQHTSRGAQNNGVAGVPNWVLKSAPAKDVYAMEKPAPVTLEWEAYGHTGEGKERELDAARRSAIWPEATDAELCADDLKARLMERLPKLMQEFRAAVESLGFTY